MATDNDFYASAAQQRLRELNAMRMRAQANLQTSLSENDQESAATEIQQIADIEAAQANLVGLAQREAAKTQQPKNLTQSERVERFGKDDNPDWRDALAVINQDSQHPISEQEYVEGYRRMKEHQSKRGTEQK